MRKFLIGSVAAVILLVGGIIQAQSPLVPMVQQVNQDDVVQIIPHAIPRADAVFATIAQINPGFGFIPNNTVLGNVSGIPAIAVPLNTTQHTTLVNTFTTNLKGAVPAPTIVQGFFLRDDGTFASAGGGIGTVTSITIAATTPITVTGTCTVTTVGTCTVGVLTASQAEWLSNTANRVLTPNAVWAGAQINGLGTVAVGSITPNFCAYGNATVTLGGTGLTLANPSCINEGQTFTLYLVQDGTGSRTITTYGSYYKFSGGTLPTLTTTASAYDMLQCTTRAGATQGVCVIVNNPS